MSVDKVIRQTVAVADPNNPDNVLTPTLPNISPVTPADGADLANSGILLIANGGAIKLTTVQGETVTVTVPAGYLMVPIQRVWSTGTTATGISVLF